MIDHTGIGVADVERSARFYDAALAGLNLTRVEEMPGEKGLAGIGYGTSYPVFWIDIYHPYSVKQHVAFAGKNRKEVDDFYSAGIAAGGKDNGRPSLRMAPYPNGYYAAFLLDPEGNNIEAVCREQ